MNKLKYYFASRKLLMAQAVDLQRQLQEAWDEVLAIRRAYKDLMDLHVNTKDQLHRVARERDECYRQKRLADIRRKEKDNG
jgi:hypothetical protein